MGPSMVRPNPSAQHKLWDGTSFCTADSKRSFWAQTHLLWKQQILC